MRIVDPHLLDRPAAHYGGVRANSLVATLISSTSLLLGKLVFESEYVAVELSMSLYITGYNLCVYYCPVGMIGFSMF